MRRMRSAVDCLNLEINGQVLVGFILVLTFPIALGYTNPADVAAINKLYIALGSPSLPGWLAAGGDPCAEAWQGIQCDNNANINSIILNGANLGGQLGDNLASFSTIKSIDLSNNNIGGSIPSNLPVTLQSFFLSDNNLIGSIPSSLSSLNQLSAMSLNDNHLSGEIPADAFEGLTMLVNLDLSTNNLSGQLPPSLENLSSLTTLRLQNNQLSGTLDVLQDLPLRDLNIENNQFSGPIPDNLLNIPNFRKNGNPFNTTTTPTPPPSVTRPPPTGPAPPFFGISPSQTPKKPADGPSATEESNSQRTKKSSARRVVWISIAAVMSFVILLLAFVLFLPRCCRRQEVDRYSKRHEIAPYMGNRENPIENESSVQRGNQNKKVPQAAIFMPKEENLTGPRRMGAVPKPITEQEPFVQRQNAKAKQDEHVLNLSRLEIDLLPPPPPPPPPPPSVPLNEKVIVNPISNAEETSAKPSSRPLPPTSVRSFTIAYLQQYTNSFSQENLIGSGMLGSVYRAELPDEKLLAVKKLDKRASIHQKDDEFLDLVNCIDSIRHDNVVKLMGYCAEHAQRLLVYEYCSKGTLHDALHLDDELKKQFSWNIRVRMAFGAARALEYLHEVCDPPIIHRNFKSANVLLDDDLTVLISDCGLAPLISSGSVSQLSGQLLTMYGYGAPEFESGIYTTKSDVYSFGVVMLEMLTGRKSYDRSRTRGEQFLVRWAIPQLHDIDALSRMVDPSLDRNYPVKSLSHFADIISSCVQAEPEFRPAMSEVVQDLMQMIRRESSNSSDGEMMT